MLRARLEALERGAEAALQAGDPRQAIPLAELAVIQEPLREAAHLLFAQALAASGDAAGALAVLDHLRRRLADELGIDPSPEAENLQTRILRGESLDTRPVPPAVATLRTVLERLPFLGREEEMASMLGWYEDRPRGPVLVSGPPGAGKSRLLEEFALRCPRPMIAARAFQPEQEEAWALARSLLRELLPLDLDVVRAIPHRAAHALGDVVPEVAELLGPGGPPPDPESHRALALEATCIRGLYQSGGAGS